MKEVIAIVDVHLDLFIRPKISTECKLVKIFSQGKVPPSGRRCLKGNSSGFTIEMVFSHSEGKTKKYHIMMMMMIIISLCCIAGRSFGWICRIPSVEAASQGYNYIYSSRCLSIRKNIWPLLACCDTVRLILYLVLTNDKPLSAKQFKLQFNLSNRKLILTCVRIPVFLKLFHHLQPIEILQSDCTKRVY